MFARLMVKMNRLKHQIFALFLVGCLSLLVLNKMVYTHLHILADGTVVSHAHPYNKNTDNKPFKSHHHSTEELVILQMFSYVPKMLFVLLLAKFTQRLIPRCSFQDKIYQFIFREISRGRSPPCFS